MPPALSNSVQKSHDDTVRMEAALLYANGDHRGAINALIARVNATNGHCSVRLWLELLDIYQAKDLQNPFEKLAGHFSSRFHLSPPAWVNQITAGDNSAERKGRDAASNDAASNDAASNDQAPRAVGVGAAVAAGGDPGKHVSGSPRPIGAGGRQALLIEGSARDVSTDKIRDVIRAAMQHLNCRLDLSRITLYTNDGVAGQELTALLGIMERIRRLHVPTMLMGDTELMAQIQKRVDMQRNDLERENPYWMVLFEILQWRGEEEEFDRRVEAYANLFSYCPVGFEGSEVIARDPTSERNGTQGGGVAHGEGSHTAGIRGNNGSDNNDSDRAHAAEPDGTSRGHHSLGHALGHDTRPSGTPHGRLAAANMLALIGEVLDIQAMTSFAQAQWAKRKTAVISMEGVVRLEAGAARSLATLLQVRVPALGFGRDKPAMEFQGCSEAVASLMEGTGVAAYAKVGTRHDKIRAALEQEGD
jgi:hypothetical protein